MTPTEEYVSRYKKIERCADKLGRSIVVGRLRISQQIRISEMTPGLDGDTEITSSEGNTVFIPRRALPLLAASVRDIDGSPIPFPRTRAELDAIMDRLEEPGFAAILQATTSLNAVEDENKDPDQESGDVFDQAKK